MKTIKQIISDADPRLKGVLMIMIVYVMVMATTVTSGATQEIKGYKETIEIQYQDGSQEAKDYLVRQDTVKNVLKELDVNLGSKDTVNKDMAYIVQSKDLLQVNRISEEEVEEIQYVDSQTIETTGLHLFTTEVVQQGQRGQINNKVKVTYENGKIVKKELLSSEVVTEKNRYDYCTWDNSTWGLFYWKTDNLWWRLCRRKWNFIIRDFFITNNWC